MRAATGTRGANEHPGSSGEHQALADHCIAIAALVAPHAGLLATRHSSGRERRTFPHVEEDDNPIPEAMTRPAGPRAVHSPSTCLAEQSYEDGLRQAGLRVCARLLLARSPVVSTDAAGVRAQLATRASRRSSTSWKARRRSHQPSSIRIGRSRPTTTGRLHA